MNDVGIGINVFGSAFTDLLNDLDHCGQYSRIERIVVGDHHAIGRWRQQFHMIFTALSLLGFGSGLFPSNPLGNDQQIAFVERILTSVTLHFSTGRFRNTVGANEDDSIGRQIVFFGHAGANRVDHRIKITTLASPFHFTNNHQVFAIPTIDCETSSTTGTRPRMALLNGRFDILRIPIDAAHNNHILQTASDVKLAVVHEAKITRPHVTPTIIW